MARAVLWFRRDLRLDDLPALRAAAEAGADGVVALFVADPALIGPAGPNRRRFLTVALAALDAELEGALVVRRGDPVRVVPAVAAEVGASVVAATTDFGPYGATRDAAVARALSDEGRRLKTIDSNYVVAPGRVRSGAGTPFKVFTAYKRAWESAGWLDPSPAPGVRYCELSSDKGGLSLEPSPAAPGSHGLPDWWEGLPLGPAAALPEAGPAAAWERLERFVAGPLADYDRDRDLPAVAGTSGLSPYLRFGCVHPRSVLRLLGPGAGAERWRTELAWREILRRRSLAPARLGADFTLGIRNPPALGHERTSTRAVRGLGNGGDRLSPSRCRDAPVAGRGLDAQPGTDGHGQLLGEGPSHRLAARGPVVHVAPGRRRPCFEPTWMAMGGRHGH